VSAISFNARIKAAAMLSLLAPAAEQKQDALTGAE